MIILSSIVNCGWYEITRGHIEILPNGDTQKHGKIFMSWYFFWFKEESKNWIHHSGKQLRELCEKMNANSMCVPYNIQINNSESKLYADKSIIQKIPYLRDLFDCQFAICPIERIENKDVVGLMPFKSYPAYRFPWWIREPLAGCITCFASFYSTLLFVLIHLFAYEGFLIDHVYGWANNMLLAMLFTWVVYCLSCAFLGTFLYRKM